MKNINFDEGMKMFYDCYGSSFNLDRKYGNKYRDCNIPVDIEAKWQKDIIEKLKTQIDITTGNSKILLITKYLQLLPVKEAINYLINILQKNLDTFSIILLCEILKNYKKQVDATNDYLESDINDCLKNVVNKLLNKTIVIDNSFKEVQYMKSYDFSDENIYSRIKKILS